MYGMERGDPYRIYYGSDSFGNTCGRENEPLKVKHNESVRVPLSGANMTLKKYLFPLDFRRPLHTLWVCVQQCPSSSITTHLQLQDQELSLCIDEQSTLHASKHASDGHCPVLPIHPSTPILNRCLPNDVLELGIGLASDVLSLVKDVDWVRISIDSVVKSVHAILLSVALALVLSLMVVFLLRFLAPVAVYFTYCLVMAVLAAISGGLWYAWWTRALQRTKGLERIDDPSMLTTVSSLLAAGKERMDPQLTIGSIFEDQPAISDPGLLAVTITATVITVVTIVLLWCLLPRGKLLVDLFRHAGLALSSMPSLLLQPVTTAVAVLVVGAFSVANALLVFTAAQPVQQLHAETQLPIVSYNVTQTQKWMLAYEAVGFIWLIEFVFAYQRMLIAGAVAKWYFDRGVRHPICASRWNTIRYHLGSLAFGSLIITLVKVPRLIVQYIYVKMKATENEIMKKLVACCICLLAAVEKCLNYLNYNAYTVVAYTGQSFCPAAKTAVNVLMDNAGNVATINTIGTFVLFLAKAAVAAASTSLCFVRIKDDPSITKWWPQLTIVALVSYQVASCFISVYEMIIDALFLCIAEDFSMEKDGASEGRHQPQMMDYMERTVVEEDSIRSAQSGRSTRRSGRGTSDERETIELARSK